MKTYVDSSVVLRVVFGERAPIGGWGSIERFTASSLLIVECFRAIDRLRFSGQYADDDIAQRHATLRKQIAAINVVDLQPEIVALAAQPFPTAVKTLDALHLATAVFWRDREDPDLAFATHDRQLGTGARALGFRVLGV